MVWMSLSEMWSAKRANFAGIFYVVVILFRIHINTDMEFAANVFHTCKLFS